MDERYLELAACVLGYDTESYLLLANHPLFEKLINQRLLTELGLSLYSFASVVDKLLLLTPPTVTANRQQPFHAFITQRANNGGHRVLLSSVAINKKVLLIQ